MNRNRKPVRESALGRGPAFRRAEGAETSKRAARKKKRRTAKYRGVVVHGGTGR